MASSKIFFAAAKDLSNPKVILPLESSEVFCVEFDKKGNFVSYSPFLPTSTADFKPKTYYGYVQGDYLCLIWILFLRESEEELQNEIKNPTGRILNPKRMSTGAEKILLSDVKKKMERKAAKEDKSDKSKNLNGKQRKKEQQKILDEMALKKKSTCKTGDISNRAPKEKKKYEETERNSPFGGAISDEEEQGDSSEGKKSENLNGQQKKEQQYIPYEMTHKRKAMGGTSHTSNGAPEKKKIYKILDSEPTTSRHTGIPLQVTKRNSDFTGDIFYDEEEQEDSSEVFNRTFKNNAAEPPEVELLKEQLKAAQEELQRIKNRQAPPLEDVVKSLAKEMSQAIIVNLPTATSKKPKMDDPDPIPLPEGITAPPDTYHAGNGIFIPNSSFKTFFQVMTFHPRVMSILKAMFPQDLKDRFLSAERESEDKKPISEENVTAVFNIMISHPLPNGKNITRKEVQTSIRRQTSLLRSNDKLRQLSPEEQEKGRLKKLEQVRAHRMKLKEEKEKKEQKKRQKKSKKDNKKKDLGESVKARQKEKEVVIEEEEEDEDEDDVDDPGSGSSSQSD